MIPPEPKMFPQLEENQHHTPKQVAFLICEYYILGLKLHEKI